MSPKERQDNDGNDAEKTERSDGDEYMNQYCQDDIRQWTMTLWMNYSEDYFERGISGRKRMILSPKDVGKRQ